MNAQQRLAKWQKIRFMKELDRIAKEFTEGFIEALTSEPTLQEQLARAEQNEDYEKCAVLRDKINQLSK